MQELVKQLRVLLPLLALALLRDIIRTHFLLAIAARHQISILKVGSLLLETGLVVVVNVVHSLVEPDIDGRCRLQQSIIGIAIDSACIRV